MSDTKQVTIIVNGRPKEVTGKDLTFLQVVQLAFPGAGLEGQTLYTVTFKKAEDKKEGTLVDGDSARIKEGTIFNVTATDKS